MQNSRAVMQSRPTNKISDVTIQKRLRRSALHPQIWARRIWSRRTKVHPTEDPDSIVVKKLGKEKLISWVAPGTSTSDLTEETPETPGVSVVGDASLATLTGTSGVSENNVPDKSSVWAWMQKSIPDEEDLWIAKVVSVTSDSGTYFGVSLLLSLVRSAIQILGSHWNEDQRQVRHCPRHSPQRGLFCRLRGL
ncbi:uncharacterized protein LOC118522701 isoform X1 [Halichoerus grypus]